MEKFRLNFRDVEYNSFVRKANEALKQTREFFEKLRAIIKFDISDQTLQDVLIGNGESTAGIIEKQVRKELESANITSSSVINAAVNGDLEKYYKLLKAKPQIDSDLFETLFVEKQTVQMKDLSSESVKDDFTDIISTQAGKQLYEKHTAMIKAMNELMSSVPQIHGLGISAFIGHGLDRSRVDQPLLNYDQLASNKI